MNLEKCIEISRDLEISKQQPKEMKNHQTNHDTDKFDSVLKIYHFQRNIKNIRHEAKVLPKLNFI